MKFKRLIVGLAVVTLLAGCGSTGPSVSTAPTGSNASKPSGWIPSLADVKQVTISREGSGADVVYEFYLHGPVQIYPTSPSGTALIEKLLRLLTKGKVTPSSPSPFGPSFGSRSVTFHMKDGKRLLVYQSYNQAHEASMTVVNALVEAQPHGPAKEIVYEDPSLAKWLASGWYQDAQQVSQGWTCETKHPPMGHPNQIAGTVTDGQEWAIVGSAKRGCVTFYKRQRDGWRSSLVTRNAPSGATIEQAEFVDHKDGFVLVEGSQGAGQVHRVLYKTSNGGVTWQAVSPSQSLPTATNYVQMNFVTPLDGWMALVSHAYNPVRVYVYHSTNGGASWTDTFFTLPPVLNDQPASAYSLATVTHMSPGPNGAIAVLGKWESQQQWFETTDDGLHWKYDPSGNG